MKKLSKFLNILGMSLLFIGGYLAVQEKNGIIFILGLASLMYLIHLNKEKIDKMGEC